MVNTAVEDVCDEGIAGESELASDPGMIAESRARSHSGIEALRAYGEDDDAATQLVEPPRSEPRWLVQITAFDRRSMETTALLTEVLSGRLSPSTQVWREGMRDWAPLERVLALSIHTSGVYAAAGAPCRGDEAAGRSGPARDAVARGNTGARSLSAAWAAASRPAALAGPAFWLINAAVALAVAAATLGVLTAGGVFE